MNIFYIKCTPNENLTSPGSSDINVTNIGSTTNGTTVSSTTSGSYTI